MHSRPPRAYDGAEVGMLAAKDVELARATARDLRAQGQAERARAVEAVLAAALATQGAPAQATEAMPLNDPEPSAAFAPQSQPEPTASEYVTLREAARALGTEVKNIRRLIARGHLPTAEANGQTTVRLQVIYDHLYSRRDPPPRPLTRAERAAERQRYEAMIRALPADKLARQEALLERLQAGERLSRAERSEMIALERELTKAAGRWLEEQTVRALADRSKLMLWS